MTKATPVTRSADLFETPQTSRQIARRIRRAGILAALLFWIVEFAEISFAGYVDDHSNFLKALAQRTMLVSFGILLTFGLVEAHIRASSMPFRQRIVMAFVLAAVATVLVSAANYLLYGVLMPLTSVFHWSDFIYVSFDWSWFLFSFTGALLAISHGFEVRERDAQLAEVEAIAQSAQLRALRYQLNPHFLFNTLNSIASLIRRSVNTTAETMVENLSDFLRTGLELDPYDDVTLAKELELQELYLGIETVRFPDRLRIVLDIPDQLRMALVPSLITQPLVENVLKYAVANSDSEVALTISASVAGSRLRLRVHNAQGHPLCSEMPSSGTRVGIANITERLRVRFGDDQQVHAAANGDGSFTATIELPLRFV